MDEVINNDGEVEDDENYEEKVGEEIQDIDGEENEEEGENENDEQ